MWNQFKNREDDLRWEAIARAIAPIVAPIILSAVWVILTKIDKRFDWLANMIAVAEVLPTVDLNIPQGVVLGSMYSSAEDVQKVLTAVIEAGEKLADLDIGDIIPEIPTNKDGAEAHKHMLTTCLWGILPENFCMATGGGGNSCTVSAAC